MTETLKPRQANAGLRDRQLRFVSVALTALATLSVLVGLLTAELQLDDIGLARGLPIWYWIGLVGLPLAGVIEWARGERASPGFMAIQLVIWCLVVWLTPLIIEGTPRFRTSYVNYGYVDPIVQGDGIDRVRFLYHNWPLFPLLVAGVVSIGIPPLVLLGVLPTITLLAYLPLLLLILRTVGDRVSWPGSLARIQTPTSDAPNRSARHWLLVLWLFPVFNWTGQDYFSPQALSYGFFLALLALLATGRASAGRLSPLRTVGVIVTFTLIVSTHVLTSLFALSVLGMLVVTRQIRSWPLLITAAFIFFGWQIYVAAPFYETYADRLLDGILRLGQFFDTNVAERVQGSIGHAFVVQLRILTTLVLFALAALSAVLALRQDRRHPGLRFCLTSLLGVAFVAPVSLYGGEAVIRALLFSLPLLLGLILLTVHHRLVRTAVVVAILVGAPLHILTHYGNELYDYVSPAELEGLDRVVELAPANIYGGFPAGLYQNTARLDSRNPFTPVAADARLEDFLNPDDHNWARREWPFFVVLGRGDQAASQIFWNDPGFVSMIQRAIEGDRRFSLEYSNRDVLVYRWQAPVATEQEP